MFPASCLRQAAASGQSTYSGELCCFSAPHLGLSWLCTALLFHVSIFPVFTAFVYFYLLFHASLFIPVTDLLLLSAASHLQPAVYSNSPQQFFFSIVTPAINILLFFAGLSTPQLFQSLQRRNGSLVSHFDPLELSFLPVTLAKLLKFQHW